MLFSGFNRHRGAPVTRGAPPFFLFSFLFFFFFFFFFFFPHPRSTARGVRRCALAAECGAGRRLPVHPGGLRGRGAAVKAAH